MFVFRLSFLAGAMKRISLRIRNALPILAALLALSIGGCSYSTSFVVVNKSSQLIEVRYRVKPTGHEPPVFAARPAKIAASEIATRDQRAWRNLTSDEFQIDQETRTVTVNVMPEEALWVTNMFHYFGDEDPIDVREWPIAEITLTGIEGTMTFTGDKSRQAFQYESRVLYTLTYK
jgi:hypothetical protein